ncbi:MAG: hypothetical protein JST42_30875 [Bacteroidetes bacterium]|nr:hypothetical protein [Bacteroidota bacterium]
MSKTKKPVRPTEVPIPEPEPGVKPGSPAEPLVPGHDPEISPSTEPLGPDPGPSEIPVPEKET